MEVWQANYAINKMDATVPEYSEKRYVEIKNQVAEKMSKWDFIMDK